MVDLDHCSYATIWAGDKDCYRGNINYLSLARSFFLLLFLLSLPIDLRCRVLSLCPRLFSTLSSGGSFRLYLDLISVLLVASSTFLNSALCLTTHSSSVVPSVSPHLPPSLHLCALNLVLRDCLCLPAGLAPV